MQVTIKEDCKSVLLDNGIEPPMLMDIEAFIQMAIESRNEMAEKLQQAEADNVALIEYLESLLKNESINWIHGYIRDVVFKDHPGAAILKELEGLRRALQNIKQMTIDEYSVDELCEGYPHGKEGYKCKGRL